MTMNIPSQFIFFNIVLIGLLFSIPNVSAADPDPLQDFCVAELNTDGLVHFQQNVGHGNSVVISGLNSQLPGTQVIANSLFGAKPPIPDAVLARAFQINDKLVDYLQAKFSPTHPH
eukprot:Gb_10685 [translate_table: standard]